MSYLKFVTPFDITGREFIDRRMILSKAEMKAQKYADGTSFAKRLPLITTVPAYLVAFCSDDQHWYYYHAENAENEQTGRFIKLAGEPEQFLKSASVSGNKLILVKEDGTQVEFVAKEYLPGSYISISGNNEINFTGTIPTKTSNLINDGDGTNAFLTVHQSLGNYYTKEETANLDAATLASAKTYADEKDLAVKDWANDGRFLKDHQSLAAYSTTTQVDEKINAHHDGTKQNLISDLDTIRANAALGATAVQPNSNVSLLVNDAGYLTSHQSLEAYAKTADVDTKDQAVKDWANAKFLSEHQSLADYSTTTQMNAAINAHHDDTKEDADVTILKKANVVDNVTSTTTDAPLSAHQGKLLNDRIDNLESVGRFLSIWNAKTGLPESEPATKPYEYRTGDYFRIGVVDETTNYKPSGEEYTGAASTVVETQKISIGNVYYYDGTAWLLESSFGGGTVQDVKVDGTSVLSDGIANIDLTGKQAIISDLANIRSGAAAGATAVQPADISDMATHAWVNNQGFLTDHQPLDNYYNKTEVASLISAHHDSSKQDLLVGTQTTGQNIKMINGNSLLGTGNLDIAPSQYVKSASVDNISNQVTFVDSEGNESTFTPKDTTYSAGDGISISSENVISTTKQIYVQSSSDPTPEMNDGDLLILY